MTDFKPGDIVNIVIEGARVEEFDDGVLGLQLTPNAAYATPVDLPLGANVTVERADPRWWPPRPDDLLRHDDGTVWFAFAIGSNTVLINRSGDRTEQPEAYDQRHNFRLVHREEATP